MKRVRLGLYIGDREYGDRFTNCLMNHFKEQLELHMYTEIEGLWKDENHLDAVILSDCRDSVMKTESVLPVIYLYDTEENVEQLQGRGIYFVYKYQEVNKIVDEILRQIGEEIKNVTENGRILGKMQILAVYALSENEYQLPLAVTLASILAEKKRVLLIDMQENSGLSQLMDCENMLGLEELLVMAEREKYSKGRMVSCIGHLDKTDVVYPVNNTECLCEVQNQTYERLFGILRQEMNYETIILNMGSRFVGFFDLLESCQEIYLMKSRGGLGQWREKEFMAELEKHGNQNMVQKLRQIQIPIMASPVISCERLVEQWKWNEFGDSIRKLMPGVMSVG